MSGGTIDIAVKEIGDYLLSEIEWLDNFYGVAERVVEGKGESNIRSKPYYDISFPAVYNPTNNTYTKLFPSKELGNYGYFESEYRYKLTHKAGVDDYILHIKGKFIFWWDYRDFGNGWENISQHEVSDRICSLLTAKRFKLAEGMELLAVNFRVQEIFDDHDHEEVKQQFAIRPYGLVGIEVVFKIKKSQIC